VSGLCDCPDDQKAPQSPFQYKPAERLTKLAARNEQLDIFGIQFSGPQKETGVTVEKVI
jgi:hypothetical protein